MSGGFALTGANPTLVVYAKPDENKVFQVYRRPLGGDKKKCLTCDAGPNKPAVGLHKGSPGMHPDGQHMILQVEMEKHPYQGKLGGPGAGWFNNLWMTTTSADKWWQLTDYPHGKEDRYGVLLPQISPDGKKVAWGQLYKSDPKAQFWYKRGRIVKGGNPWGYWQLNIADLVMEGDQVRLESIESSRPGNGNFYEPQDWSPDGRKLMFAADINRDSPHKMDLWLLDVQTEKLTALTDTDWAWEEFGSFSPDGKKIMFMSSECCNWDTSKKKYSLKAELYVMDADGSNKVQVSHFNGKGHPESSPGRHIVTKGWWSHDGKKILVEVTELTEKIKFVGTRLWEFTLE